MWWGDEEQAAGWVVGWGRLEKVGEVKAGRVHPSSPIGQAAQRVLCSFEALKNLGAFYWQTVNISRRTLPGALCTVGDAVKGCATHTAGMSCRQSIESVSRGRQRGEEWWGRGTLFGRDRVHRGSELEVGSATSAATAS
ncbi:unnamed protein product [Pleuronectes platessa]|uniref:Uncharacterized protein n=1 Tax=Pleuronectes platessa TaxID=8262 RepID=A0A9N7Z1I3_PLEPL|nr:unnamed protein product [Pleuronectes platessa]